MNTKLLNQITKIVSGGQTGADRAALDFAIANSIQYGGWCPKGGWAEDFPQSPGIISKYPNLRETPRADPAQRTQWNVRDSSLTLILLNYSELERSDGTVLTKQTADKLSKPSKVVDMSVEGVDVDTRRWLEENLGTGVLNIAGPRESESPNLYLSAKRFLGVLFGL
ncbi:MAG: putative molybdenum carrier protein [Candidatus Paceibacterota bacterium]